MSGKNWSHRWKPRTSAELWEQAKTMVLRVRGWPALETAALDDARDAFAQALHLHRSQRTLHKELKAAEVALASDSTEENFQPAGGHSSPVPRHPGNRSADRRFRRAVWADRAGLAAIGSIDSLFCRESALCRLTLREFDGIRAARICVTARILPQDPEIGQIAGTINGALASRLRCKRRTGTGLIGH
jgi:hypothetical protein